MAASDWVLAVCLSPLPLKYYMANPLLPGEAETFGTEVPIYVHAGEGLW